VGEETIKSLKKKGGCYEWIHWRQAGWEPKCYFTTKHNQTWAWQGHETQKVNLDKHSILDTGQSW